MVESASQREWRELVGMLDAWAHSAVARGDDCVVTLKTGRVVRVVMTADDLDDMHVAFGALPEIFQLITERLAATPEGCDHLVYTQYELEALPTRESPAEPEAPMPTGGRWSAHDSRRRGATYEPRDRP